MADSNRGQAGRKAGATPVTPPRKPRADFPLYAHRGGKWAKKVLGRTVYFTRWDEDPTGQAALEEWVRIKDDLLAGREPRVRRDGELTVADLANQFLDHKRSCGTTANFRSSRGAPTTMRVRVS